MVLFSSFHARASGHDAAKCLIGEEYNSTAARPQIDYDFFVFGIDQRQHVPVADSGSYMIRPSAARYGHCAAQYVAHFTQREQITGTTGTSKPNRIIQRHFRQAGGVEPICPFFGRVREQSINTISFRIQS